MTLTYLILWQIRINLIFAGASVEGVETDLLDALWKSYAGERSTSLEGAIINLFNPFGNNHGSESRAAVECSVVYHPHAAWNLYTDKILAVLKGHFYDLGRAFGNDCVAVFVDEVGKTPGFNLFCF